MITVTALHKQLGTQPVLRGVDLHVAPGEVVALIGPSGTGKSVLLKHMVGLLLPDQGDVVVDGVHVSSASREALFRLRRRMGYAFQDAALLDSLDVRDNLQLSLTDAEAADAHLADERIAEALERVNLPAATLQKRPSELSGGMRKRVGVARAVINRPQIVLYDEPTTGLDPANAEAMHALIRRIADDTGATSVVVTHDVHAVGTFADRVITLTDGRVIDDRVPQNRRFSWS
jgi:phospholipid/cholesterol/gamma-HCH transport system ATP-binding protein